jgi:predicted RNA-binding Zn-ribbon protein involved in translation (DUF1610 family)
LGSKNQSTDRILSWRNSVHTTGSTPSTTSVGAPDIRGKGIMEDRSRSNSPRKFTSRRFSFNRNSPPNKETISSPTGPKHNSPSRPALDGPSISVTSPLGESPESFHSVSEDKPTGREDRPRRYSQQLLSSPTTEDVPNTDPLLLMGEQSYMAWDVKNSLVPMARHMPRTPGLLDPDTDPLTRVASYVSQLSSELTASDRDPNSANGSVEGDDDDRDRAKDSLTMGDKVRNNSSASDLQCQKCGNQTFRATMTRSGQRFRCKKCGTIV